MIHGITLMLTSRTAVSLRYSPMARMAIVAAKAMTPTSLSSGSAQRGFTLLELI